jgi:hypothetical protein
MMPLMSDAVELPHLFNLLARSSTSSVLARSSHSPPYKY